MPDLSMLNIVPTDQWDKSLAGISNDMHGQPLNVHQLLANNPNLLKAWWPLRMYAVSGGTLGKRNAELVILRTAVHVQQWYEWASHVERGLDCGLSLEEIERVIDGPDAPGWSDQDAELLAAVDEQRHRDTLSPESLQRLAKYFSHDQVLDLIAIHSIYVMLGSMLNTWDVPLDARVSRALPGSETREHFFERLRANVN
ncbi:MAG: carboxymuconolactone decarboxylase family protein [Gammaproteobacteria bacterium]|nr:carboxymuconolactone decarboxylase family protein [Gammaproteobacteria bacterium]